MRLFVALDLPKEVKDYVYSLQKRLNSNDAKVKWVSKKHLHVTIKFLGDVDEKKAGRVVERLASVKRVPVKVKLSDIGFFPDEEYVRVIWVGLEPEDVLNRVAQDVDGELLDLFPGEQKFSAHLTLGRIKAVKNRDAFFNKVKGVEVEPLEFELSWLKLYKSILKGSTQEYVCLNEF